MSMATHRTPALLAWRYGAGPMGYRVVRRGRSLADGFAVFRLRARGPATEATVCDVVHPSRRVRGELLGAVLRETGADYAIAVQHPAVAPGPAVRIPGQGPVLTWKALARPDVAPIAGWDLRLGDIELF
jgi:hypothetical protein